MGKIRTCGACPFVSKTRGQIQVVGCMKSGNVVPHHADYALGRLTFWRVPEDCPRPDSEVSKNKDRVARKLWEYRDLKDLPIK